MFIRNAPGTKKENAMALKKDEIDINNINCDDFSQADFFDYIGDDLFEVTDYFWEYLLDGVRKQYMVYGQPLKTVPSAEVDVYDRYTDSVRKFLNFCSYNYLSYSFPPGSQTSGQGRHRQIRYRSGFGAPSERLLRRHPAARRGDRKIQTPGIGRRLSHRLQCQPGNAFRHPQARRRSGAGHAFPCLHL